jgi:hypothetical protein
MSILIFLTLTTAPDSKSEEPIKKDRWLLVRTSNDGKCLTFIDTQSISFQTPDIRNFWLRETSTDENVKSKCFGPSYAMFLIFSKVEGLKVEGLQVEGLPVEDLKQIDHYMAVDCPRNLMKTYDIYYFFRDYRPVSLPRPRHHEFEWSPILPETYGELVKKIVCSFRK